MKKKRLFLILLCSALSVVLLGLLLVAGFNLAVIRSAEKHLLSVDKAVSLEDVDCILVLGCKVHGDGEPSDMLEDRLLRGLELYEMCAAPKLLMSGDHGQTDYDEVDSMKRFAVDRGVPSENVFMDHAGFSTYESMYRARDVFQAKKIIIVTQGYHLYRAVYIARALGLEAYGVDADLRNYSGQSGRDFREILARVKDFWTCVFQPEPTYLGLPIPISGDGNLTNDKNSDFS